MIRIEFFDVPGGVRRRMYENRVPVGVLRGGDGTNTDRASNQLVQFFLRKFFEKNPALFPRGSSRSGTFALDGKVGPQTIEGITRFQAFHARRGIPLFEDSRVSVATGVTTLGSGKRFTIHTLNSFFFQNFGEKEFDSLSVNPEIKRDAPELAAELAREEQLRRRS